MSPERRALLNQLRAEHSRAWSCRSPLERFERADAMRAFALAARSGRSGSDEPLELLQKLAARRRARYGS